MNKKNFLIICTVIVLCICFSIFNGRRKIKKQVETIKEVFEIGEDKDNLSIYYDLSKIDDSLGYTIALAKANEFSNDHLKSLENLHKDFESIDSIKEYSQWYKEVKEIYPFLISELEELSLSNQHLTILNKYKATYNSSIHTIGYSNYNQYVNDYNDETSGMIANIMKLGIEEVVTFD